VHMHPRDAEGVQSLAARDIGAAVAAVRNACPGVPLGVSTLYAILPNPAVRAAAVLQWHDRPDFASVNFGEPGTEELCAALQVVGVRIEAGLDSAEAAERYVRSPVFGSCLRVLLEPGEQDVPGALATVAMIEATLGRAGDTRPRLLHGEGPTAWALFDAALGRGYDTRIGLEDVLMLPNGASAPDNAALVAEAVRRAHSSRASGRG
jgi:uncharacterized protein (DUF849 family)